MERASSKAASARPVLILGGYGGLGSRTARALRRLHSELPIVIAGRDVDRAHVLADEGVHLEDAALVRRLAEEKLEAAAALEPEWKWTKVACARNGHPLAQGCATRFVLR